MKNVNVLMLVVSVFIAPGFAVAGEGAHWCCPDTLCPIPSPYPPLAPMLSAYNASSTDNFYTIRQSEHDAAVLYENYVDTGTAFYVEYDDQSGPSADFKTGPFRRFYNFPKTNHFYTFDGEEISYILANGWYEETHQVDGESVSPEGHIYRSRSRAPGSVRLHRLNKVNYSTGDHMHKYTISSSEVSSLQSSGWGYDGVVGYVYDSPFPEFSGGFAMGKRCGEPNSNSCPTSGGPCVDQFEGRRRFFGDWFKTSTARPFGTTVQWISFDFKTWDLQGKTEHVGVMLRACVDRDATTGEWDTDGSCQGYYYHGVGLIFGELGSVADCIDHSKIQFAIEEFRNADVLKCQNTTGTLEPGVLYNFYIQVSDSGLVSYTVKAKSSGSIIAQDSYNVSGSPYFAPGSRGLYITGSTESSFEYTNYFSNISYGWKP